MDNTMQDIQFLCGKTLVSIKQIGSKRIDFETADKFAGKIYHEQECCETVEIKYIRGDLQSIVGSPVVKVECACSELPPDDWSVSDEDDCYSTMWTRQRIEVESGAVVELLWFGESNGYYSEGVDFLAIKQA